MNETDKDEVGPDSASESRLGVVAEAAYLLFLVVFTAAAILGRRSDGAPAPAEKKDGWRTFYTDREAQGRIFGEATYLGVCFVVSGLALVGTRVAHHTADLLLWGLPRDAVHYFCVHLYAFFAGLLGGTLFSYTWLRQSVYGRKWNQDYFWWRISQPLMSGTLGLITVCLIQSGLFKIFDTKAVEEPVVAIAVGFLAGYFSDSALVKFREIAMTMFGAEKESSDKKSE